MNQSFKPSDHCEAANDHNLDESVKITDVITLK